MSDGGNTIAVTGNLDSSSYLATPEYVRVFHKNDKHLTQLGTDIDSNSPVAGDFFGRSIAMSSDGSTLAIAGGVLAGDPLPFFMNVYQMENNVWQKVGQTLNEIGVNVAIGCQHCKLVAVIQQLISKYFSLLILSGNSWGIQSRREW
jgi:hypothetical protein